MGSFIAKINGMWKSKKLQIAEGRNIKLKYILQLSAKQIGSPSPPPLVLIQFHESEFPIEILPKGETIFEECLIIDGASREKAPVVLFTRLSYLSDLYTHCQLIEVNKNDTR